LITLTTLGHLGQQLTGPDFSPQAYLGRVLNQFSVLCLLGIDLHRDGFITNVLHLIDPARLGQNATRSLIEDRKRRWARSN
jgi:hypothetical protein